MRRGGVREERRHRERGRDGKEERGDMKHSQSNLKLVDVWGARKQDKDEGSGGARKESLSQRQDMGIESV